MSLVSYALSDSDDETQTEKKIADGPVEDQNANKPTQSDSGTLPVVSEQMLSVPAMFASLPKPRPPTEPEEEVIEPLVRCTPCPLAKKKMKIQINIPDMKRFGEEEEEPPKKILRSAKTKPSGLISVLPSPKTKPKTATQFVPATVSRRKHTPRKITKEEWTSDEEEPININFLRFLATDVDDILALPNMMKKIDVDPAKEVKDPAEKDNKYFSDLMAPSGSETIIGPLRKEDSKEDANDEETIAMLLGKGHSKRAGNQKVELIDIKGEDIMPDPTDWQTKALTEEKPTETKKEDEPSVQSKRKHQITYLAYQAKRKEQEYKNEWAMNKMSRKQTQAKYGF